MFALIYLTNDELPGPTLYGFARLLERSDRETHVTGRIARTAKTRGCACDNWKTSFYAHLIFYVHFRYKLQYFGHVGEEKSRVDQSELEK